jgi:hypothetical protein
VLPVVGVVSLVLGRGGLIGIDGLSYAYCLSPKPCPPLDVPNPPELVFKLEKLLFSIYILSFIPHLTSWEKRFPYFS